MRNRRQMDCKALVLIAVALSVSTMGCMITPIPVARGQGNGLFNRRCSDCTPPWIPCWTYWSCVDDIVVYTTAKHCGCRAFSKYRKQCRGRYSKDFKAGFVQSHIDLAQGRYQLPPIVPPSRYYTAYYRSCAGERCVNDWYAGYQAGLEVGRNGGTSQFNRVDIRTDVCR